MTVYLKKYFLFVTNIHSLRWTVLVLPKEIDRHW